MEVTPSIGEGHEQAGQRGGVYVLPPQPRSTQPAMNTEEVLLRGVRKCCILRQDEPHLYYSHIDEEDHRDATHDEVEKHVLPHLSTTSLSGPAVP